MLQRAYSGRSIPSVTFRTRNVAINDVLPLKTARADAIAHLKYFRGLAHQRLNFDGFIYIRYAAPTYSAGTLITASVYGGWFMPCFVTKIFAVKFAVKLQSRRKKSKIGGFGLPCVTGMETPNFGHAFSNRNHFQTCGRLWWSSVQWVWRVADERKISSVLATFCPTILPLSHTDTTLYTNKLKNSDNRQRSSLFTAANFFIVIK